LNRKPIILLCVTAWWILHATLFASQIVAMTATIGSPMTWSAALVHSLASWTIWIPVTLVIMEMVARTPLERANIAKPLIVLSATCALSAFLIAGYIYVSNPVFAWYHTLPGFSSLVASTSGKNLMIAATIVMIGHALIYYERIKECRAKAAEMKRLLESERLRMLRSQLNPHFLFNAMGSVTEMMHVDVHQADEMMVSLSALLRDSIRSDAVIERPVRDEVELIRNYLMIEKIRLSDRLCVKWEVDSNCLDAMVPSFILQPLVENAVVHAIARHKGPGRLVIAVAPKDGDLLVSIQNSWNRNLGSREGNGVGLKNTRERLDLLYGDRASLESSISFDESMYVVVVRMPLSRMAYRKYGIEDSWA
jgi:sensor histidine kinase YesM